MQKPIERKHEIQRSVTPKYFVHILWLAVVRKVPLPAHQTAVQLPHSVNQRKAGNGSRGVEQSHQEHVRALVPHHEILGQRHGEEEVHGKVVHVELARVRFLEMIVQIRAYDEYRVDAGQRRVETDQDEIAHVLT